MSEPDPNSLQEDFTLLTHPAAPLVPQASPERSQERNMGVAFAAVVLLLAVIMVWLRWRQHRSRHPRIERPDKVALRELGEWSGVTDPSQFPSAIVAVSGTVRRYVEGRFGLNAPTLTTEEFWARQRANRKIPESYDSFWKAFIEVCDRIKYAGMAPDEDQFRQVVSSAIEFVRASRNRGVLQ